MGYRADVMADSLKWTNSLLLSELKNLQGGMLGPGSEPTTLGMKLLKIMVLHYSQ